MPNGPIDPASLEGDELTRWYLRSPDDIEQERQAATGQRYRSFFGQTDPDPDIEPQPYSPLKAVDPGMSRGSDVSAEDIDTGANWVPASPNRWRSISVSSVAQPVSTASGNGAIFDTAGAGPDDGHQLFDIGNPANRRLRKEYEEKVGPWPKTDDARNYHVAHGRAIADGGTNTLDNIRPMHPDAHIAEHMANGDLARWARRASIARAFGGRVAPPTASTRLNGLGIVGIIPNIAGFLSGRIRTDTPMHTLWDLAGYPAPDDYPPLIA